MLLGRLWNISNQEAMHTLEPDGVNIDNIMLLVTEMVPLGKNSAALQVIYPELMQVTSVQHVLHRIGEKI
jgi:hypothetical protein